MQANFAHDVLDSARGVQAQPIWRGGLEDVTSTVFIVDDDVSVRESLELLIRSAGWQAKTFASAEEFLSHQHRIGPCCVVLDMTLPGLTGLELQQRLAERTDMPIIFITGHADVPMTVRAMKSGAFEFLTKPVNTEVLVDAIRAALHRSVGDSTHATRHGRQTAPHSHDSAAPGSPIGTSPRWRAVLKLAE